MKLINDKFTKLVLDNIKQTFQDRTNQEEIASEILTTSSKILTHGLNLIENGKNHNLLVVGKVQSGKTSNLLMTAALAFDNGYNTVIIYGGYDKILLQQTIDRINEAFGLPSNDCVHLFSTKTEAAFGGLDTETLKEEIFENGGKILIVALKDPAHFNKINNFLDKVDTRSIKALIIDDEGDQASLNTKFKKRDSSATYNEISRMKEQLHNPLYLSVTATPQALIFSPKISNLLPADACLINPGEGYCGLEIFHFCNNLIYDSLEENVNKIIEDRRLPVSLKNAVYYFFIVSAIKKINNTHRNQMIIHTAKEKNVHKKVYSMIHALCDPMKSAIEHNEKNRISIFLKEIEAVYNNTDFINSKIKSDYPFKKLIDNVLYAIKRTHLVLQDGDGKETMANLSLKKYQIRIGADLLQRGVTFKDLSVTYFTRWPKGKGNMDTIIQRARWLGYRGEYINLCKVFCTPEISYKYEILSDIEQDVWDQLMSIEGKQTLLNDIIIDQNSSLKLNPTRKNVAQWNSGTFGRRWLNQNIVIPKDLSNINTAIIDEIIGDSPLSTTSVGRKDEKTSAWYKYISWDQMEQILLETKGIFNFKPFNIKAMLKLAKDKKIILELLFDPKSTDKRFYRARSFKYINGQLHIPALQQGANSTDPRYQNYKGDSHVIPDNDAVIIQVSQVVPKHSSQKSDQSDYYVQYMFSILIPEKRVVYEVVGN